MLFRSMGYSEVSMASGSWLCDDSGRELGSEFEREEDVLLELLSGRKLRLENEKEGLKSLGGGENRRSGAVGFSICTLSC